MQKCGPWRTIAAMKRAFVVGLAALTCLLLTTSPLANAQAGKVWRIGWLQPVVLPPSYIDAVLGGLRDLGYVEKQNLLIEYRWADGKSEQLPELADELVRLKVDVLISGNSQALQALKRATNTIPIVMLGPGDPVGTGLIQSLARPGGNITGTTTIAKELSAKRLDLAKQLVPGLARVGCLANPANPLGALALTELEDAARAGGVTVQTLSVGGFPELGQAFSILAKGQVQALFVTPDTLFIAERGRIVDFAVSNRLPSIFFDRVFVDTGGLLSYGADFPESYRRAALYIDKIFKGAKPRDLPVERPTKMQLVINMKAARALGIVVPQSILLQATDVIQ